MVTNLVLLPSLTGRIARNCQKICTLETAGHNCLLVFVLVLACIQNPFHSDNISVV